MPRYVRQDGEAVPISELPFNNASEVAFTDSGLVVINGLTDVQSALEAVDVALDERATMNQSQVHSIRNNFSNDNPTATTQTWGTTDAITGLEGAYHINAWMMGYGANTSGTDQRISVRVDISINGGTSWNSSNNADFNVGTNSTMRIPLCIVHSLTGTVSGDVIARAIHNRVSGGSDGDVTLASGSLMIMAFPIFS